jgi:hypothetical protein
VTDQIQPEDEIALNQRKLDEHRAAAGEGGPNKPVVVSRNMQDSMFTADRQRAILGALANNHFMPAAAALAGVASQTVYRWIRLGKADMENGIISEFADFAQKVDQATATGEHNALGVVNNAAKKGDVRAAQWILERRHGDRGWAKKDTLEIAGDPSQPIVVQLTWPGAPSVVDASSEIHPVGGQRVSIPAQSVEVEADGSAE